MQPAKDNSMVEGATSSQLDIIRLSLLNNVQGVQLSGVPGTILSHVGTKGTDLGNLLLNCAQWVTHYKSSNVLFMVHGVNSNDASNLYGTLPGFSLFKNTTNAFDSNIRPLEVVDLLILNLNNVGQVSSEMFQMMDNYLKRGGGIIVGVTSWAHFFSFSLYITFQEMSFFTKTGISFSNNYASSPYVNANSVVQYNPYFKLDAILQSNTIPSSFSEVKQIATTLDRIRFTLIPPVVMAEQNVETFSKTLATKSFVSFLAKVLNSINTLPLSNNPEIQAGEIFPGLPQGNVNSRNTKSTTVTIQISSTRRRWQCTGYYALPGANITITVSSPNSVEYILIGSHTDNLENLDEWNRWPSISSQYYISSGNSTSWFIAFNGGTIFVSLKTIPVTDLSVTISGQIVKTPFWRFDKHTNADWINTIRNEPGPWIEVETEHIKNEALVTPSNTAEQGLRPNAVSRWGHYHELGHNFQRGEWTYDQSGELTNNIYSLYLEENFPENSFTYARAYNPPRGLEKEYKNNNQTFKGDWTSAGVLFYLDQIQAFGWVAIRKHLQVITIQNRKVLEHYLRCEISGFSMCLLSIIENNKFSTISNYVVKIVTWAPVRHFYGERFVFRFSGLSVPQSFVNNTMIPITLLDGTTALDTTASIVTVSNQEFTMTILAKEYIKSGQVLRFSFQAKNSAQIGEFQTFIKVVDSKKALVNAYERPIEFSNKITRDGSSYGSPKLSRSTAASYGSLQFGSIYSVATTLALIMMALVMVLVNE
ncbi:hypothetical protein FDP41_002217 [Naegleria fowleri]|uniref:Peptidase M60 domain-containing protein n=1 Tax=Naegleria fowleri TaxID=5763 RepID=A0A6A5BPW4_NAEFO|nr:uncharacterized protein FDP41_002217 [Naegleria fowleri]KAF0979147.1 hypothetical protein FDP41_002217 [Naegleria fowleri]